MKKIFYKLMTFGLLTLVGFACARPNYQNTDTVFENTKSQSFKLTTQITWIKPPSDKEMGVFDLSLINDDQSLFTLNPEQKLQIVLWMPSMGHASAPVKIEKLENFNYRVSNVKFIMRGEWEIRIQISSGDQIDYQFFHKITY